MLLKLFLIAVCHCFHLFSCFELSPTVITKTGSIRGRLVKLSPKLHVYEFTGIPFAEPPTGQRRFSKTVPKMPWKGVLNAIKQPPACPQTELSDGAFTNFTRNGHIYQKTSFSEDCLFLNIWVPRQLLDKWTESSKRSAVFTYIHGGAFDSGSITVDLLNGTVLAAYNNIIVTSMQYRLGSLGFGYGGTEKLPGNMGLWDQLEALKWLCENIDVFGGNCSQTALAGSSSGAACVTLHMVSQHSRRYFTRAIIQSGTALAPWAVQWPERASKITNMLFQKANCKANEDKYLPLPRTIACLQKLDSASFPKYDSEIAELGYNVPFSPVIDGDFIAENPYKTLDSGHFYQVPMLIGANKDEGSIFFALNPETKDILPFSEDKIITKALSDLNFTDYNAFLDIGFSLAAEEPLISPASSVYKAVQLHYWPTTHVGFPQGHEVINAAMTAVGDYKVTCPTYTWLQVASNFGKMGSQTFAYHFTQRRSQHSWPSWTGVMQGDELHYIFGVPFAPFAKSLKFSVNDKLLSQVMMALWTNFAKYGDPNIRDVETANIARGPLQQRPWPSYVGSKCAYQIVEMNTIAQVYQYGNAVHCALKIRDCLFWSLFYPKLKAMLDKNPDMVVIDYKD